MKIYTLIEDHQVDLNFGAEHGVSFYIETKNHNVLFDVGQSSLFLSNAHRFKLDISLVDVLIISHGHYDHGGGLEDFMRVNKHAIIYIQESALHEFYSLRSPGTFTYIGLSEKIDRSRINFIKGDLIIDDELKIINYIDMIDEMLKSNQTMYISKDNQMILDDFEHEQSLIISEDNHHVLFAGCGHKGILNILAQAQKTISPNRITEVFGGFHLESRIEACKTSLNEIKNIAESMIFSQVKTYYTGHCTGDEAFIVMKNMMKEKLEYFYPGLIVELK